MAVTLSSGITPTLLVPDPDMSFPLGSGLNYAADFRRVETGDPNVEIIQDVTTPRDQPRRYRFGYAEVKNVYSGLSIDPSLQASNRTGVRLLVESTETWSKTDTVDSTFRQLYPFKVQVTAMVPLGLGLTDTQVMSGIKRGILPLFEQGDTGASTAGLGALLRGILIKKAMA